ncbi:Transcription factor MYB1R1 like [Actinidia chinensis var. chinensis]|uniref:Transcription factor MYB1R1 like n=1 Tax=Actinidia chinensis var. chinensis TaxID=1590841 RepID=A0A2R6QFJ7_ACTCC|nr:Transcription factor MYB1R1 like [Actinidia chinensis var. chinensis]
MTRRCSHCSNNGHNSRTCPWRGGGGNCVKLFGVRLTDGSIIKKSASMGNLSAHYHSSSSAAVSPNPSSPSSDPIRDPIHVPDGYLSDDPAHATCSTNRRVERKKGVPWTEEEHRLFLIGLHKLGKGDWRGISRSYVTSRTPTQVASHAQKYFIRHSNATRRKRRSSLFDMVPEMGTDQPTVPEDQFMLPPSQAVDSDTINSLPSLKLSLSQEFEPMEAPSDEKVEEPKETVTPRGEIPTLVPAFFSAFLPVPFAMWPSNTAPPPEEEKVAETFHHQVLRPTPVIPKEPVNVDQLVGMSQLNLGEAETGHVEPSLSLNLLGAPSRPSAFHASTPANKSDLSEGESNVIQAV